jgi:hypothetical protein
MVLLAFIDSISLHVLEAVIYTIPLISPLELEGNSVFFLDSGLLRLSIRQSYEDPSPALTVTRPLSRDSIQQCISTGRAHGARVKTEVSCRPKDRFVAKLCCIIDTQLPGRA